MIYPANKTPGLVYDLKNQATIYEDFIVWSTTNNRLLNGYNSGAGSGHLFSNGLYSESQHPGVVYMSAGTATNGVTGMYSDWHINHATGVRTVEAIIKIPTLSNATDEYEIYVGFVGDGLNTAPAHGAYFRYKRATSTSWQYLTTNSSTSTTGTSSVTVAADWVRLRVELDIGKSIARFYINGNHVGSNTTNIPDATDRTYGTTYLAKSASSAAESIFHIDAYLEQITGISR